MMDLRNRLTVVTGILIASATCISAEIPTTAYGKPSLEGQWDFKTATPLNRRDEHKDKEFFTPEEISQMENGILESRASSAANEGEVREGLDGQRDVDVGYNSGFLELGSTFDRSMRTSLIVDPPSGRMPAMLDSARERNRPYVEMQGLSPSGPEQRSLTDRCIIGFNNNPMRSGAYNNIMQIVQSESHVAIHVEMVNDHRIVPTDGGAAVSEDMRFWKGHSVGEWDGDTFVVTSTNYKQYATPYSTGPNVVMTERFTRLDEDTLQYEYTIDDPETYETPFTARQQMVRTEDQVYEYACHEGNYSMPLTLRAARKMELDGRADKNWMPSWHKR